MKMQLTITEEQRGTKKIWNWKFPLNMKLWTCPTKIFVVQCTSGSLCCPTQSRRKGQTPVSARVLPEFQRISLVQTASPQHTLNGLFVRAIWPKIQHEFSFLDWELPTPYRFHRGGLCQRLPAEQAQHWCQAKFKSRSCARQDVCLLFGRKFPFICFRWAGSRIYTANAWKNTRKLATNFLHKERNNEKGCQESYSVRDNHKM